MITIAQNNTILYLNYLLFLLVCILIMCIQTLHFVSFIQYALITFLSSQLCLQRQQGDLMHYPKCPSKEHFKVSARFEQSSILLTPQKPNWYCCNNSCGIFSQRCGVLSFMLSISKCMWKFKKLPLVFLKFSLPSYISTRV